MGKIILFTGTENDPKLDAAIVAWYAEGPESRRIARTPKDIERGLQTGNDVGIKTLPVILETRRKNLLSKFPVEVEVRVVNGAIKADA